MAEEMNMGEVVMVVDDNKEIVYSISELLKYEGYRVIPAYDGMEALNLLEQNPVDLILLDATVKWLVCSYEASGEIQDSGYYSFGKDGGK